MAKPTRLATWATDGAALKTDPGIAKQAEGWAVEIPPVQYENWFKNLVGQWVTYFDTQIDSLLAIQLTFDAIVGIDGTHATLAAAIADVGIDSRIYVKDPATLTSTVVVNKEGLEISFAPGAAYAKGATLVKGLQIDAKRIKIYQGRFLNFNEVGGTGIELTANAKNCFVKQNTFVDNTTEIENNGANNNVTDNMTEVA